MPYHPSAPSNRFVPTLAVALLLPLIASAQFPARTPAPVTAKEAAEPKKDEPATEAELLVDEAIAKLKALTAVEADVLQQVSMLGQDFRIRGQYVKGPGYQFRLELNLSELADVDGTMLQICDGRTLWNYQKILNSQDYRRLGIDRILKRLDGPEFDDTIRQRVIDQFGFSGPDALLVGLRKSVLFDQKEEDTFEGKAVWVVRGAWKDRNALAGAGQAPPGGPIPPYVPSVVAVTIGREDGWPYRVEMRGRPRPTMGLDKKAAPRPSNSRQEMISSVVLTYTNVRLNPNLDASRFAFQSPDPRTTPLVDQTEEYLAELEKAAQINKQAKSDPAAGMPPGTGTGTGALDQPIPLPRAEPKAREGDGRP